PSCYAFHFTHIHTSPPDLYSLSLHDALPIWIVSNWYLVLNDIGFQAKNRLNSIFSSPMITMRETLHIAVVGNGNSLMPPFRSSINQFFHGWQGIHGGHIGMSVKFHSFLTFWHEVLALMVHNFFDILHIHGQGMGEAVVFHISTHTQPSTFGNHIVFF